MRTSNRATRLLARQTVLPGEDASEYERLLERLQAELHPEGVLEETCFERIADAVWRLRRAGRLERDVFATEIYGAKVAHETNATEVLALTQALTRGLNEEEEQLLAARVHKRLAIEQPPEECV